MQIDKIQKFDFFVNAGVLAFIRAFEAYGYAGYLYRLAVSKQIATATKIFKWLV